MLVVVSRHDGVIKGKKILCSCSFVGGIHRSLGVRLQKGYWRGALVFLWCVPGKKVAQTDDMFVIWDAMVLITTSLEFYIKEIVITTCILAWCENVLTFSLKNRLLIDTGRTFNKANLRDLTDSAHVTLKFDGWSKKNLQIKKQAFNIISKPMVISSWSYSPKTLNSGQNLQLFFLSDLIWPCNLTDDLEKQ